MNYLWSGMLLIGIIYAAFTGRMQEITDAALNSSKEAVTLCISMTGVMSLWLGLMAIARDSGLIERLSKAIRPLVRFLFPGLPKNHPAGEYIATNMIANILGLGMAATPAGLKAMESLQKLNEENCKRNQTGVSDTEGRVGFDPKVASDEMCTFLILNISSLQLIPVNMIAYRSQYGSVAPAAIVGPAIVATTVSTVAAVLFCKVMHRR